MSFTLNGTINSAVWLEYSTNGGSTWTRLPTSFPIGNSIVTSALPTGVNLKLRVVAVCDETLISNVLSYDIQVTCKNFELAGGINGRSFDFTNCDGLSQTVVMPQGDSADFCIRLPFSAEGATLNGECTVLSIGGISNALESFEIGCDESTPSIVFFKIQDPYLSFLSIGDIIYNTNDETSPFMGENSRYYKIIINNPLWAGASSEYVVSVSNVGVIQSIPSTCP